MDGCVFHITRCVEQTLTNILQIFDDDAWESGTANGMGIGINAGCSAVLFCVCRRIHLWTRFALRLWLRAMLAIEAPGWAHS